MGSAIGCLSSNSVLTSPSVTIQARTPRKSLEEEPVVFEVEAPPVQVKASKPSVQNLHKEATTEPIDQNLLAKILKDPMAQELLTKLSQLTTSWEADSK